MPHISANAANSDRRDLRQPMGATTRILDSTLASADIVENAALESARWAGFFGTALEKIGLAIHEIVINAIIHGNRLSNQKKVIVNYRLNPKAAHDHNLRSRRWIRPGSPARSSVVRGAAEGIWSRNLSGSGVHGRVARANLCWGWHNSYFGQIYFARVYVNIDGINVRPPICDPRP